MFPGPVGRGLHWARSLWAGGRFAEAQKKGLHDGESLHVLDVDIMPEASNKEFGLKEFGGRVSTELENVSMLLPTPVCSRHAGCSLWAVSSMGSWTVA